mmetsp:Transcript_65941/g.193359  ORF Transcript_65941/g.193359 Transcript_65941/m.193359 type:complete len:335 (-) Transcript_65941:363-1367(-)
MTASPSSSKNLKISLCRVRPVMACQFTPSQDRQSAKKRQVSLPVRLRSRFLKADLASPALSIRTSRMSWRQCSALLRSASFASSICCFRSAAVPTRLESRVVRFRLAGLALAGAVAPLLLLPASGSCKASPAAKYSSRVGPPCSVSCCSSSEPSRGSASLPLLPLIGVAGSDAGQSAAFNRIERRSRDRRVSGWSGERMLVSSAVASRSSSARPRPRAVASVLPSVVPASGGAVVERLLLPWDACAPFGPLNSESLSFRSFSADCSSCVSDFIFCCMSTRRCCEPSSISCCLCTRFWYTCSCSTDSERLDSSFLTFDFSAFDSALSHSMLQRIL